MRKPLLLLGFCGVLLFGLCGSAVADPTQGPPICTGPETAIAGNYRGDLRIWGDRYVASGTTLRVRGDLTVARGSCLDAFTLGTVTVRGNVRVDPGAILALGCTPGSEGPVPPCNTETTTDTVGGNIIANHPWTMYLDGDTIWGSLISFGGGPGPTLDPYVNFPVKDNVIHGNVWINGWQGAWFGFIRNVASRNVILTNNVGVTTGDSGTPDSTEVVTNTISDNLICFGNRPPAQIGDSGGSPNTVGGRKIGQCAGL